ncbi:hypothetical protein niasHT_039903 [Heterodera trifolii]|uniref:Serpentine receptor class gamma n=1 Tax=Heterodera trifolii TaxID=157864 RepID=A0ABD2I7L4_9BILA
MLNLIIVQFVSICIAVPSLFLYALECWFIFEGRNQKFEGSFYKIFLLSAINNIFINLPNVLVTIRAVAITALFDTLASMPGWLARLIFASTFYNVHVENCLTFLLLAHRLSAIVKPLTYEKAPSNSKMTFIVSTIFLILCVLLNCAILVTYRANAKKGGGGSTASEQNAKIEFRLMVYTLLIFVIQAFVCLYWIAVYLFQTDTSLFIQISGHYILLNDARALVMPAWFLLWASGETRKIVGKFIFCAKNGPNNAVGSVGVATMVVAYSNGGQPKWHQQQQRIVPA